ncbi:MAG TPA: hypothetical protein V6C86_21280 [Oculatellaceae cyanobacterium]
MVWIARIDFAGFGNLSGEKIEFEERKLNLVLESDVVGKSTVFGALWATLFDFPIVKKINQSEVTDREKFMPAPGSGLPYISGTDLFIGQRYLKVIRDFNEDAVQLVDMSKSNADVTSQFFTPGGEERVGLKITGMSRDVFRRLAVVSAAETDENKVGRLGDLSRVLNELLAKRPHKMEPEQSIAALDDALTFFPHHGKKLRAATVLRDLEGRFYELNDKVNKMQKDRTAKGLSLESTKALPKSFSGGDQYKLTEYFEQCMELADLDGRLANAQETLLRVKELRTELDRIGSLEFFTLELQKQTEELFTRCQSRQQDLDALVAEFAEKIQEFEVKQKNLANRYIGLDVFHDSDAQALSMLSREYNQVSKDLSDYRTRRKNEVERLRSMGIDIAALDTLRNQLQSLSTQDYEDARTCDAQLVAANKQISDGEQQLARDRSQLERIDHERQGNASKNKKLGLISGIMMILSSCGTGGVFLFMHPVQWVFVDLTIALDSIFLVFTIVFSVFVLRPHYFKRKEYQATEQDIKTQTKDIGEVKERISALEVRLDTLAHRTSFFPTGNELLLRLREFAQKIPHLKELEYLDKTITSSEASLSHLRTGVEPYFARAGRMTLEIRPDTTTELCNEIAGYVTDARELQTVYGPAKSAKEQMEFLTNEIKEIQKQLLDNFIKGRMEHLHDYNESLREFHAKIGQHQQWNSMKAELHRLENDMSSGFVPDELPPQIERLERARKERTSLMIDLVNKTPSILELAPKAQAVHNQFVNVSTYSQKAQPAATKRNIDALKMERDSLSNLVRAANSSDASYVLMLQELKIVQSELVIVKRVKAALEHARDRIVQDQTTPGVDWRVKLNDIMEDMLSLMGIENPNYDAVLADTSGGVDIGQTGSLIGKPFSLLTMEQVRWFARAVVTRVLALNESFPLVLNEPFGLDSEPVREQNMPFIFSLIELKYQVLALTSDATRFESAYRAASEEQRRALHTCARVALGS